jgi:hypothetical protein
VVPNLPPAIEGVSISIHKILPSILAVSFEAQLNDRATSELRALHDRRYLPTVRFRRWAPWRLAYGARSEGTSEQAMQEAVLGYFNRLRMELEELLGRYFCGYFLAQAHRRGPRLPAIELLTLGGCAPPGEQGSEWLKGAYHWADPLGFASGPLVLESFHDKNVVVVLGAEGTVAHRVLVLDPLTKGSSSATIGRPPGSLRSLVHCLALFEFVRNMEVRVADLRLRVYHRLSRKFRRFRRDMALDKNSQRQVLLLSRFSMEFKDSKETLRRYCSDLARFGPVEGRPSKDQLLDVLVSAVEWRVRRLAKHINVVSDAYRNYLLARNIDLGYRLQRRVLFFTIIVTFVTLIAYWPAIEHALARLLSLVLGR